MSAKSDREEFTKLQRQSEGALSRERKGEPLTSRDKRQLRKLRHTAFELQWRGSIDPKEMKSVIRR